LGSAQGFRPWHLPEPWAHSGARLEIGTRLHAVDSCGLIEFHGPGRDGRSHLVLPYRRRRVRVSDTLRVKVTDDAHPLLDRPDASKVIVAIKRPAWSSPPRTRRAWAASKVSPFNTGGRVAGDSGTFRAVRPISPRATFRHGGIYQVNLVVTDSRRHLANKRCEGRRSPRRRHIAPRAGADTWPAPDTLANPDGARLDSLEGRS